MISREDRILSIDLIDEAVTNGAREFKVCEVLNISQRTLFRWRSKDSPNEVNALMQSDLNQVIN